MNSTLKGRVLKLETCSDLTRCQFGSNLKYSCQFESYNAISSQIQDRVILRQGQNLVALK